MLDLFKYDVILEPSLDLSSSHDNCPIDLCNKYELCASDPIIHVPQLLNEIDSCILEQNTCAETISFLPITTQHDELKLLSSLHTLENLI